MANTKIPSELSSTPSISDNGDATAITIDSSERIGIGITSPTVPLHISSTGHTQYQQHRQSSSVGTGQEMKFAFDTADGTEEVYGSIYTDIKANTNGAESGNIALRVADAGALAYVIHGAGGGDTTLYADGDAVMTIKNGDKVGINTTTVPHGSTGHAMFAMDGANNNSDGPHVQYTTAADDYPVFQQLNWGHDNISLNFDMYYDGSWRSSDAGSNYQIYKYGDELQFQADTGITAGGTVSQEIIGKFDTSGRWHTPKQPHVQGSVTTNNNTNSQAKDFTAGTYSRGTLSVNVVSNQARFTAPVNGLYLILFATIMGTDSSRRDAYILVNGTTIAQSLNDAASGYHYRQMAQVLALSANDYVTFGADNWYDNTSTGYTVWRTASMTLLG